MGLAAAAALVMTTFAPRLARACSPPVGVCEDSACCGPYTAVYAYSTWEPSTDDSGVVLYAGAGPLRRGAGAESATLTSGSVMFGQLINGTGTGTITPGGLPTSVVAYDIAGNSSAPGPSGTSCVPTPDAGLGPAADAGADAPPSPSCRANQGREDVSAIALGVLALLAATLRRRGRPASTARRAQR